MIRFFTYSCLFIGSTVVCGWLRQIPNDEDIIGNLEAVAGMVLILASLTGFSLMKSRWQLA